jgi:hypothetical protein
MASSMAGVGFVTVSERRSMGIVLFVLGTQFKAKQPHPRHRPPQTKREALRGSPPMSRHPSPSYCPSASGHKRRRYRPPALGPQVIGAGVGVGAPINLGQSCFLNVITLFFRGFDEFEHTAANIIPQPFGFSFEYIFQFIQFICGDAAKLPQLPLQRIRRIGDLLTGCRPFRGCDKNANCNTGNKAGQGAYQNFFSVHKYNFLVSMETFMQYVFQEPCRKSLKVSKQASRHKMGRKLPISPRNIMQHPDLKKVRMLTDPGSSYLSSTIEPG